VLSPSPLGLLFLRFPPVQKFLNPQFHHIFTTILHHRCHRVPNRPVQSDGGDGCKKNFERCFCPGEQDNEPIHHGRYSCIPLASEVVVRVNYRYIGGRCEGNSSVVFRLVVTFGLLILLFFSFLSVSLVRWAHATVGGLVLLPKFVVCTPMVLHILDFLRRFYVFRLGLHPFGSRLEPLLAILGGGNIFLLVVRFSAAVSLGFLFVFFLEFVLASLLEFANL
jgi:hypothetical protein